MDRVIVATTVSKQDDKIEKCCIDNSILCFRGSEEDVLDRYLHAAKWAGTAKGDYVVRITADCPFIDFELIDNIVATAVNKDMDYVSNTIKPTFPDGLDVEVFKYEVLEHAWSGAELKSDREHVTPFIYKHPELFSLMNFEGDKDYSELRWTLDEPEDFEVIEKVYEALYHRNKYFTLKDILLLYEQDRKIFSPNEKYKRNEGYVRSIKDDKK